MLARQSTALVEAALNGHEDVVQILLSSGARINFSAPFGGDNALGAAIRSGNLSLVQFLLQEGADINAFSGAENATALVMASKKGSEAIVRRLLDSGAFVNTRFRRYGGTALYAASEQGNSSIVRLLLAEGAELNPEGSLDEGAELFVASELGHIEVVRLLLGRGANVNALGGPYGQTPLEVAYKYGRSAIVQLLLNNGAILPYNQENWLRPWMQYRKAVFGLLYDLSWDCRTNLGDLPYYSLFVAACFLLLDDLLNFLGIPAGKRTTTAFVGIFIWIIPSMIMVELVSWNMRRESQSYSYPFLILATAGIFWGDFKLLSWTWAFRGNGTTYATFFWEIVILLALPAGSLYDNIWWIRRHTRQHKLKRS